MGLIQALAISIGALAAVATYLFLGWLPSLSLWAVFIAWATFYHCGGKEAGLTKTITHNIFGAVLAWIALVAVTKIPLGATLTLPVWAGICVGVTVFILVFAASNPALSDIPASVYGYAPVAALSLFIFSKGEDLGAALTSASLGNPLINIVISMIIGALFGYVSEKIAGSLAKG
jgi:Protein of unknown function (DUF1097)